MPDRSSAPADSGVVRREVLRFAVPGVIGIVLLAVASLVVAVAVARDQSLRDATVTTQWLARSVVEPRLSTELVAGRPAQIAALDEALAVTVAGSDVVGLRIWDRRGVVIYADDPRIIGEKFPIDDRISAFAPGAALSAHDADITRPENRYLDQPNKHNGCSEGADALRQWAQAKDCGLLDGMTRKSTYKEARVGDWRTN